jgi:hypothetical protein
MRHAVLAVVAVLVAIPAAAQNRMQPPPTATPQTPVALSGQVEAGDMIFVTDRNGLQTGGRLQRLSAEGLALLVDGQERMIPSSGVGRIEKRDSLWNGMLMGAVPGTLIGMAGAGASCSPHCGREVALAGLVDGAIGAGIGALIDFGIHRYSIIDGPPLASPNARRVPEPVALLEELWRRVRQGDTIEVGTIGGQTVRGKFVQSSSGSVMLLVRGGHREIRSSDIRVVTRAGNRYRSGALWGGVIVGSWGVLASADCRRESCGNPLFMGMVMGSAGALWGTVIGAVMSKHPVVYESGASSNVRVVPVLHGGRVGVALSARF